MDIKISTTLQWPLSRQIPSICRSNDVQFYINSHVKQCDAWIVYQGLYRPETTICEPENVILFTYEPPGLHSYQSRFLNQFSKVITCHRAIQQNGTIYRHQAQPWLAGLYRNTQNNIHKSFDIRFTFSDFAAMPRLPKTKRISVLCSNKVLTEGHRRRLSFVDMLQRELNNEIDVFGYGFQPLVDKWDALAPYQYHIVLENSVIEDYWTEKLADAYLGYCFPIVAGCPNLSRYFSDESFLHIDIANPAEAITSIRHLLSEDPYEKRLNAVFEARRQVLEQYNLFTEIVNLVNDTKQLNRSKITLKDERLFLPGGWAKPWIRPLRDKLSNLYQRSTS